MEQTPQLTPLNMTVAAPSVKDLHAGFVFTHVNKITDQPTFAIIDQLQQQFIQNAATVESTLGGGNNGLS
eukprot:10483101-Ditylum_brightwellii.AAC.1